MFQSSKGPIVKLCCDRQLLSGMGGPVARSRTSKTKEEPAAAPLELADVKERALLDATIRLLGRGGLALVTHRGVAREAGVSLGVVTYRYGTIDLLLAAAVDYLCGAELTELTALADALTRGGFDPVVWSTAFAKALAGNVRRQREREIASFELTLAAARHPHLRRAWRAPDEAYCRLASVVLRSAGSRDPDRQARTLVAAITGLELRQLSDPRPHFEEELALALRDLVTGLVCTG